MVKRAFGLLLLLYVAPGISADGSGNYAIWGAGSRSCNQFQRALPDDSAIAAFREYLMGYLTAYNTLAENTYKATGAMSLEDALAWLDAYCDAHKIDSFERAITQLVITQHESRQRQSPRSRHGWGRAGSDSE